MKINLSNISKLLAIIMVTSVVLYSCKDDFTEEDLLNKQAELAQDNVELAVLVYNGSVSFAGANSGSGSSGGGGGRTASDKGLGGLDVTISLNGTPTVVQTDGNGLANFTGLRQGTISGVVSGAGFTTTNFVVSVKQEETTAGKVGKVINAGVMIPVYETEGANTTTIAGTVTCDTNLLNNTRENVPDGTTVSFSIVPRESSYGYSYDYYEGEYEYIYPFFQQSQQQVMESLMNARVESLSFEGNFVATISGGQYSIVLPTAHEGMVYNVQFSDFTANQTLAVDSYFNEPDGSVRDSQVIPALFTQQDYYPNYYQFNIPNVNVLQLDIDAPPAAGSGAAATVELASTSLAPAGFTILAAGTGYPISSATIPVTINGGNFNSSATGATAASLTANSDANGRITSINVGTAGFGYRSQATLTIGGGGTGAVVRVNFQSTIAQPGFIDTQSGTTLTSGGSGYVVAPTPVFRGYNYLGEFMEQTGTATVSGGAVVSFTVPGTTWSSPPAISFRPVFRQRASAFISGIGNNGEITNVGMNDNGTGYNPLVAPNVILRDLRNAGSGATFIPDLSAGGTISGLIISNNGTGYSRTGNANYPTSARGFEFDTGNNNGSVEYPYTIVVQQPGTRRTLNAYYGTGIRTRELNVPD